MSRVVDDLAAIEIAASPGMPALDPFDRMLLSADGTVTRLLEAVAGEPILTLPLEWPEAPPSHDDATLWQPDLDALEVSSGELPLLRRVRLVGATTRITYVVAESSLLLDRMPRVVVDSLAAGGSSIGRVLAAHRVESRREIVGYGSLPAVDVTRALELDDSATAVWRSYRVMIERRPAMLITELFSPGRLSRAAARPDPDPPLLAAVRPGERFAGADPPRPRRLIT